MPIAVVGEGRQYAVHADHLNTRRRLTQEDGKVAWQWAYSAFGEEAPTMAATRFTSATTNPTTGSTAVPLVQYNLRYPGQYFDEESGLHYNHFRRYDSKVGRYTQADPIGLEGGWNRFGYSYQNPLMYTDPTGLLTWESWWESSKAGFQSGLNDPWGEVNKAIQGIVPGEGAAISAVGRGLSGLKSCFATVERLPFPKIKNYTNADIGRLIGWGKDASGAIERGLNVTAREVGVMEQQGINRAAATQIRDFYANEFARNSGNAAAAERVNLMNKIMKWMD